MVEPPSLAVPGAPPTKCTRPLAMATITGLLLAATVVLGSSRATAIAADERAYLDRINALRASVGVTALTIDQTMAALAVAHTQEMVATRNLHHTPVLRTGVDPGWTKLGENVGYGPTVDVVWRLLVGSPVHYANMIDPLFERVGISVIIDDRGIGWTTHRFVGGARPPAVSPTSTTTVPVPRPTSTTTLPIKPAPIVAKPVVIVPPPAEPARVAALLDALLSAFR